MTDQDIVGYLDDNGYPPHIVAGGRAGLIDRWRKFVEEAERGYAYNLHNYRNDLDIRGLIRMFDLESEVAEHDGRFEDLLVDRERRVWESGTGEPFWDFGYPRNAGYMLLRDLQREGLVSDPS